MLNLPEIIIVLVIMFVIFGMGKLSGLGSSLGKAGRSFKEGLEGKSKDEEAGLIDITPENGRDSKRFAPKPGARTQPIDDADVEPSES